MRCLTILFLFNKICRINLIRKNNSFLHSRSLSNYWTRIMRRRRRWYFRKRMKKFNKENNSSKIKHKKKIINSKNKSMTKRSSRRWFWRARKWSKFTIMWFRRMWYLKKKFRMWKKLMNSWWNRIRSYYKLWKNGKIILQI